MLRTLFITASLCGVLLANSVSCSSDGVNIKVYLLDNEKGGLVREQEHELVLFKDANKKYFCEEKEAFKALVIDYRDCKNTCGKPSDAK